MSLLCKQDCRNFYANRWIAFSASQTEQTVVVWNLSKKYKKKQTDLLSTIDLELNIKLLEYNYTVLH